MTFLSSHCSALCKKNIVYLIKLDTKSWSTKPNFCWAFLRSITWTETLCLFNCFNFFIKWAIPDLYFRLFNTVDRKHCSIQIFTMTGGFELRTSGVGSNRSTNWATSTARLFQLCHWSVYLPCVPGWFSTKVSLQERSNVYFECVGRTWIARKVGLHIKQIVFKNVIYL